MTTVTFFYRRSRSRSAHGPSSSSRSKNGEPRGSGQGGECSCAGRARAQPMLHTRTTWTFIHELHPNATHAVSERCRDPCWSSKDARYEQAFALTSSVRHYNVLVYSFVGVRPASRWVCVVTGMRACKCVCICVCSRPSATPTAPVLTSVGNYAGKNASRGDGAPGDQVSSARSRCAVFQLALLRLALASPSGLAFLQSLGICVD